MDLGEWFESLKLQDKMRLKHLSFELEIARSFKTLQLKPLAASFIIGCQNVPEMCKEATAPYSTAEFLIFTGQAGKQSIEARYEDETVWLSQ